MSTAAPLDLPGFGVILKTQRAATHELDFRDAITGFLAGNPYRLSRERDGDNTIFRVWVAGRPLPAWSLLLGDFLYNTRSALEHLAWELVLANNQVPDTTVTFPVFTDPQLFNELDRRGNPTRRSGLSAISKMSAAAQQIITDEQPYDRPDDALNVLHCLARDDRHRYLHLVGARLEGTGPGFSVRGTNDHMYVDPRPQEAYTLAAFVGKPILHGLDDGDIIEVRRSPRGDFDIDCYPSFFVSLPDGGPGEGLDVLDVVHAASARVAGLMERLWPHLGPSPHAEALRRLSLSEDDPE